MIIGQRSHSEFAYYNLSLSAYIHNCLTMSLYIFTMFIMYPQHIIYVAIYRVDCAKSDKFLL